MDLIKWEMITLNDDCPDAPDERQDGYWPSQDKADAGSCGKTGLEFEEEWQKAQDRYDAWKRGDWNYVGVIARAHISLPIGQGNSRLFTIDSAGLWGIESDAGDYLSSVFEDEKAQLLSELKALGKAIAA